MNRVLSLLIPLSLLMLLFGCAQNEQGNGQGTYEETKKMVIDILKTDNGKEAIRDILSDKEVKQTLVMEQAMVKDTIIQTLTSDDAKMFWKEAFNDPKFAEAFAKSIKKEHEELIKNLMNDPEYRLKLIEIYQDPEMQKELTTLLTSQKFREKLQTVISETFESPVFKAKLQDLLLKGAEEIEKKSDKQGEKGEGGEQGKEGDQGGGGS